MDVVVTGRHIELSERFRDHVADKLGKLEKHDHRIMRVQVEVESERNPRQADRAVRVELTACSKGSVIRAEAAADDKMGALDLAVDKMAAQMRRANDRRARSPTAAVRRLVSCPRYRSPGSRRRRGDRAPGRLAHRDRRRSARGAREDPQRSPDDPRPGPLRMELVGHDFYLYVDQETQRPAVVYRRRGYDYGVISLDVERAGFDQPAWPVRVRPGRLHIAHRAHIHAGIMTC